MPSNPRQGPVHDLISALDDALDLLGEYPAATGLVVAPQNPASLLEQCLDMCADRDATAPEPVRTLHHFACTGGSLISKCLGVMPNTQLLSEVDPLSSMQSLFLEGRHRFSPTDLINLARQGTRGIGDAVAAAMFQADLDVLRKDCTRRGLRLVLRDHAHGHFCRGSAVPDRPSLRELVKAVHPVLSVITVRHPLDSYLSLAGNGWLDFTPRSLDEYSLRYLAFLDAHDGLPCLRYEDFLADPAAVMQALCGYLDLPYNPEFKDLFDVILVTGDSGRSGSVIEARPRRQVGETLTAEAAASPNYRRLLRRLGYED